VNVCPLFSLKGPHDFIKSIDATEAVPALGDAAVSRHGACARREHVHQRRKRRDAQLLLRRADIGFCNLANLFDRAWRTITHREQFAAPAKLNNQPLEWTGPAERSLSFEAWSVPGRPFNVDPLSRLWRSLSNLDTPSFRRRRGT
jgi:hypothetical protein